MSARSRVLAYAAVYAAVVGAFVLAGGADDSLLCDDAFYYFQIARHAATGHGFSFDNVHPTNGFHPLWAWLCVPIWRRFGDDAWRPIHVALLVLVAATAATALVLFRIGRALSDDTAGERAALLFLLSPFTLLIPLRGCEAALSALTLALATWAACVCLDRSPALAGDPRARNGSSVAAFACLGFATGTAGLARTDHVLFGAAMMLLVIISTRSWRATAIFAAVAAVTVAPWLVWTAVRCGTIVQVSGAAKRAIDLYGRLPSVSGVVVATRNVGHSLVIAAGWVSGEEWRPKRYTGIVLAATAAQLVVAARSGHGRPSPRALWPLYAYCALHLAVYAWYYRAYYTWYALPLALAIALFCGERVASRRAWRVVLALAATASIVALVRFGARGPFRRHGAELSQAALLTELARLPPGSRVGLENAGAVGYFAGYARPDMTVVNLDCVVNNAAFAAWRRHDYAGWLLANVDWVERAPDSRFIGAAAPEFAAAHLRVIPGMLLLRVIQ
ncbi:MAG TPA: hypothetical protein VIA18_29590 [Polyangia bacterium]|nr:hypothetical protein [Polyangia bacterium]